MQEKLTLDILFSYNVIKVTSKIGQDCTAYINTLHPDCVAITKCQLGVVSSTAINLPALQFSGSSNTVGVPAIELQAQS